MKRNYSNTSLTHPFSHFSDGNDTSTGMASFPALFVQPEIDLSEKPISSPGINVGQLWDPSVLDRLQMPLTRFRE